MYCLQFGCATLRLGLDCVEVGFVVSILVLLDLWLLQVRFGYFRIGVFDCLFILLNTLVVCFFCVTASCL